MDAIPMFTVAKSFHCKQSRLSGRCLVQPDKEGTIVEVLSHSPLRRLMSHQMPLWNPRDVGIDVSENLVVFWSATEMLVVNINKGNWSMSPLHSYDPIKTVIGCNYGRQMCVVTDGGILIVGATDLMLQTSVPARNIVTIYCQHDTKTDQLLLTYLTDKGIVFTVNVRSCERSNKISPTHGCEQCAAEPCTQLLQDPDCKSSFIALHEDSQTYTFFAHTPETVWIAHRSPCGTADVKTMFAKWSGEVRKRSLSR